MTDKIWRLTPLLLISVSFCLAVPQCPDSSTIMPCSCSSTSSGISVTCDGLTAEQIQQVFSKPFPSAYVDSVNLLAVLFPSIPAAILGGKQTGRLQLECADDQRPFSIDSDAFRSSENTTELIGINFCNLNNVDFSFLEGFRQLKTLQISACQLTQLNNFPVLEGLRSIFLVDTQLRVWYQPKHTPRLVPVELRKVGRENAVNLLNSLTFYTDLEYIYLGNNDFTEVPQQVKLFKNLKTISLYKNPINKLLNGSLHLPSKLTYLDFYLCPITDIEYDAFGGEFSPTNLYLKGSLIETLSEEVFGYLLPMMQSGSGSVNLDGAPLKCGCDLKWLIQNSRPLLSLISKGRCLNGTALEDLNPDGYNDCN